MPSSINNRSPRERILARLKKSGTEQTTVPQASLLPPPDFNQDDRVARLAELMTAMRTEVHIVKGDTWLDKLKAIARQRGWKRLLYGPQGPLGPEIETKWSGENDRLPQLTAYSHQVETFKDELFQSIDVGLTSTRGGVADTGAIVLWPTPAEPRLLSLVPPVHVAVLDAGSIHNSLSEMIEVENWDKAMPTNALLISGPSKTADIEFTLVFGVHGPKELAVIIRT